MNDLIFLTLVALHVFVAVTVSFCVYALQPEPEHPFNRVNFWATLMFCMAFGYVIIVVGAAVTYGYSLFKVSHWGNPLNRAANAFRAWAIRKGIGVCPHDFPIVADDILRK